MLERLWHLVSFPFRQWATQHSPVQVSCDASSATWNAWSTYWQPLAADPSWCECFECPGCSSCASLPAAESSTQALRTLDLEIYDKALARVGEVTPDVCRIEELVTSELSQSPAKPAPGSAEAAGRMDTPASSTSPRLASTSPSTKRHQAREAEGRARPSYCGQETQKGQEDREV